MTLTLIFTIIAVVCFGLDAAGVPVGRLNLTALGLLFLTLALTGLL